MTKEEFLKDVDNFSNHRYLLWEALERTKGLIVEMGMGNGSTPFLHQYCEENNRQLRSYENNLEWYRKFQSLASKNHQLFHIVDWDDVFEDCQFPSVLFMDHAPGERRKIDLEKYQSNAAIIICHDTEPEADHGYQMRPILSRFKYKKEHESNGAWATMVSNFIEL